MIWSPKYSAHLSHYLHSLKRSYLKLKKTVLTRMLASSFWEDVTASIMCLVLLAVLITQLLT